MRKTQTIFGQINLMAGLDTTPLDKQITLNDDPQLPLFLADWYASKFFALDIETMGVGSQSNALDPFRGKIRLIQIGLANGQIAVIDLTKPVCDRFWEVLEATLRDPNKHPIGHNIQFDLSFIKQQLGYECRSPRCTRIMSILRWCGIKQYRHSLKDVYKRLFGEEISKEQQKSDWSQPQLSNSQLNYAANDVRATYKCFLELCKQLRSFDTMPAIDGLEPKMSLLEIVKVECDVIPAFVELILTGQPVDIEYAEDVKSQYRQAMANLYQPVFDVIGLPFSAESSKICAAFSKHYKVNLTNIDGKDSSGAAILFQAYCDTKNEATLRLALTRSLKKSVDAIGALIASAKQNDGYCKGLYTSLGNIGSGRSNCKSDKTSSLDATNLQNLPGIIEHPLVAQYNLPPVRSIIRAKQPKRMFINDLSASHLRLAASNSGDDMLVKILDLKDPHAFLTSQMFTLAGKEASIDYCIENKKKDPEVAYFRQIAKESLYTQFNDGKSFTFKQSLNKSFVDVSLEDCELAQKALEEAFPGYTAYAKRLGYLSKKWFVEIDGQIWSRFRTHDGRLFHVRAWEKVWDDKMYNKCKLGEITSANLISPEAIVMKRSLIDILEFLRANRNLPIKLNSFCHDDVSGEDYTEDKVFAKFVYKTVARYFTEALNVNSGLDENNTEGYKSTLVDNYSQK